MAQCFFKETTYLHYSKTASLTDYNYVPLIEKIIFVYLQNDKEKPEILTKHLSVHKNYLNLIDVCKSNKSKFTYHFL